MEKIRKELGIVPGSEADEALREMEFDNDFLPDEEMAAIIKRRLRQMGLADKLESGGDDMTTEAQKRASAKYDATHTKQIKMKLNLETDADIIARLEEVPAVQTYIKELIRADIGRKMVEH